MLKFEGKALVSGGAGFIGSHVAREVMKLGMDVVVLDDLSGGFEENIPPGGDLRSWKRRRSYPGQRALRQVQFSNRLSSRGLRRRESEPLH